MYALCAHTVLACMLYVLFHASACMYAVCKHLHVYMQALACMLYVLFLHVCSLCASSVPNYPTVVNCYLLRKRLLRTPNYKPGDFCSNTDSPVLAKPKHANPYMREINTHARARAHTHTHGHIHTPTPTHTLSLDFSQAELEALQEELSCMRELAGVPGGWRDTPLNNRTASPANATGSHHRHRGFLWNRTGSDTKS